jgi:replicative DNA helicase
MIIPPHSPDIERAVLGALILSEEAYELIEDKLMGGLFYKPAHEAIYDVIIDLYSSGKAVDPLTVTEELTRRGLMDKIGGQDTLSAISNEV